MIVCICRRVTDRDIVGAVRDGCTSFEELQSRLGVATGCGKCRDCACDIFHGRTASAAIDSGAHAVAQVAATSAAPLG